MALFEGNTLDEARSIVARYPTGRERSAVMPLLYLAQSIEGHVTRDGLREVASLLGLTTAEVEAVASFYTMIRLRPTRRWKKSTGPGESSQIITASTSIIGTVSSNATKAKANSRARYKPATIKWS